jgi:predicted PurR-regulated permease PerM
MDSRNKWKSPQAIIVMVLILLIFSYIGIDMALTKPQIKTDLKEFKTEYTEFTGYLEQRLPEIDSTLKIQAGQISNQGAQIDSLNQTVKKIIEE